MQSENIAGSVYLDFRNSISFKKKLYSEMVESLRVTNDS